MFISKKKYEEALQKAKWEVADQWERKFSEYDKRRWEDDRERERSDYYDTRFKELSKRIYELEKALGMVEEPLACPYAVKSNY